MNSNSTTSDTGASSPDSGWQACLELEVSQRDEKSVVSDSRQKGPLTIQSPFYPENEVCHLYLLHPPAGIVGGDKLNFTIVAKDKGSALVTTPGATKFYTSNGKLAYQQQSFTITDGASLEWLPQETIYFPDANAHLRTIVHLSSSAQFLGWDIHCLGLPANNKDFGGGQARVSLSIYRDGMPLLLESIRISSDKKRFQAAFLQNQPVFGSFVTTGGSVELLESLRERMSATDNGVWAATLVEGLIIVRYLGASTGEARKIFIESWKVLRPLVLGRYAVLPRIWAT